MDYFSPAMSDRLALQQRRGVASLMEVYDSPTVVRQKFEERLAGRDSPSRLVFLSCLRKVCEDDR
jgi:hypothetical protein